MVNQADKPFQYHMTAVKDKKRIFENAFCGVSRMILESDIQKVIVNGKTTFDFSIFRTGNKHIIGMYEELNSFVSYVKDAAERGSSSEMAYVLVGEPGNYPTGGQGGLHLCHRQQSGTTILTGPVNGPDHHAICASSQRVRSARTPAL
jgi:serine protein kinase